MNETTESLARLAAQCDHPMIVRGPDGGTYCTECKARLA